MHDLEVMHLVEVEVVVEDVVEGVGMVIVDLEETVVVVDVVVAAAVEGLVTVEAEVALVGVVAVLQIAVDSVTSKVRR